VTDDGTPIAYTAAHPGLPVRTSAGREIGRLERVLADSREDIFHGIVVRSAQGRRFVARDHVERITTAAVVCRLTDAEADRLPEPTPGQDAVGETIYGSTGDGARDHGTGFVVIVRCSGGGLFQTLWVPGLSLKAARLGPFRIMRCPVHGRVEVVRVVNPADLTAKEQEAASRYPPGHVP
jgi:hypothetical protein